MTTQETIKKAVDYAKENNIKNIVVATTTGGNLTYLEDEKDKENESSVGAWYSYYKGIESHVQLYEKNLLVYRINYNEYTGGAHGIYMTTYLNFDLGLMRPLRLIRSH